MKMKQYRFKITHDKGSVHVRTVASSIEAAVQIIMAAEGCPKSAIKHVKPRKRKRHAK